MVRLGAGLEADGRLNKEVAARALACLERFGQRLRDMRPDSVRVVGTNALRRARRKEAFIERAREALGHPIEIVSGIEEARLIYSGVSHTMPAGPGRRLVCDIGRWQHRDRHRRRTRATRDGESADRMRAGQRRVLRGRQVVAEAHAASARRGAPGHRALPGRVSQAWLGRGGRQLGHGARDRRQHP
jgi:hypothetical protein